MAKKLSDFKALLFDVDKTLTRTDRTISPRTQAALKKLADKGVQLTICTGRHYAVLYDGVLAMFPLENPHITCAGGQVIRGNKEVLWEKRIPAEICQEIYTFATERQMSCVHPYKEVTYFNQFAYERYMDLKKYGKDRIHQGQPPEWGSPVLFVGEITDELIAKLDTYPEISYKAGTTAIDTPYVDITAVGVNKSVGIMEWSKVTGIDPSEIIGFGDAHNDEEFLQLVGWSVAMGNAHQELKEMANRVIGHTDEDGLAMYLEGLLQGEDV